ncbi:MAG: inositol-3-phosphate synthase [Archaeoglobaceae archaeon]|nr:inositol-3-phosphate synthase [Archaeoglobaceae archaeon]MCX8152019.1 inositol-3-phosphate synthase [Archaeoglobaceae archaeon]MDW8013408.1 inositol-3-phosphate synthase [Archaeoglobaceae archaeon]
MKVWLIGAYGIVSTTAMVGAKAIEKELVPTYGLVSALPFFKKIDKYAPFEFDFGGHEIRILPNAYEAAKQHWELNRHFDKEILEAVKDELELVVAKTGTAVNCGPGILELGKIETLEQKGFSLEEIVEIVEKDIRSFADEKTVVINLASTEPPLNFSEEYHSNLEGFERMIEENKKEYATASMIYAYAALKNKVPYANFTPSVGSNIPALKELAEKNKVPHAGNDGKTGETLVKTTLAPMFLYRNLEIVGWMSYNILGDLDGKVLSRRENKESKILSKDKVLEKSLGYSPYSITEIDFFPSLADNKTAFDFIHFRGFLGKLMKFYFIWDAIDAIVAAPLVLDLARFLLFAKMKGVKGVVKELAFFFKSPMDCDVVNTFEQFEIFKKWFLKLA